MSDHKAEAERLTALAADIDSNAAATCAVAHATLYLAEQQRIANLIAGLGIADSQHAPFGGTSERDFLVSQIREGLGLS